MSNLVSEKIIHSFKNTNIATKETPRYICATQITKFLCRLGYYPNFRTGFFKGSPPGPLTYRPSPRGGEATLDVVL